MLYKYCSIFSCVILCLGNVLVGKESSVQRKAESTSDSTSQKAIFSKLFQEHIRSLQYLDEENPRCLILFSGAPGMGKSTVALHLEGELHALRISSDEIRTLLQQNDLPIKLINEYLRFSLAELQKISSNRTIILDTSVDRTYDEYTAFAQKNDYGTFLIRMQLSRQDAEERIRNRDEGNADAILNGADVLWKDYELFGRRYSPDYVFDNATKSQKLATKQLVDLEKTLKTKLLDCVYCNRIRKGSPEYYHVRKKIQNFSSTSPKSDAQMHKILPGLYLGNQLAADAVVEARHELPHISHILSIRTSPHKLTKHHIVWKGISLPDTSDSQISVHFNETYEFIESATGAALVHCQKGMSRSSTLVIAYLMKKFSVSYDDAYRFVKSIRPIVSPNSGFRKQLKKYEATLQIKN